MQELLQQVANSLEKVAKRVIKEEEVRAVEGVNEVCKEVQRRLNSAIDVDST